MSTLSKYTLRFAVVTLTMAMLIGLSIIFSYLSSTSVYAEPSPKGLVSYADAVDIASPSVVSIYTAQRKQQYYSQNPMVQQYLNQQARINGQLALNLGSGVIMDQHGYILTNNHVVKNATTIQVALKDGRRTRARLIGRDPDTDLAVLKINLFNLKPITLESPDNVQVGEVALAIGNAFGLEQTVTQGIISAQGRRSMQLAKFENFIQTDAAINPGNSGGALIDTEGKLIGINTAILSRTGGNQGIGFAIPAQTAKEIMLQIIKNGHVSRGWLGVNIQPLTAPIAKKLGASLQTRGIIITQVLQNTPAANSHLRPGDIVTAINNQAVKDASGFMSQIGLTTPNSKIALSVIRKGKHMQLPVTIGSQPQIQAHNSYSSPRYILR